MKKQLLFVNNSLKIGGAEKSLVSLLNTIDYSNYDIDLLCFNVDGELLSLIPSNVHILPQLAFLESNSNIKKQITHPVYLYARIRASIGLKMNKSLHDAQCYWKYAGIAFNKINKKYDAAIAWGQGNPTHYVATKVISDKKIAMINADYEAVGHNKNFDLKYYDQYTYIACVSNELTSKIKKVFPQFESKIETLYDINNAKLIEDMASLENPFSDDCINIVTVGRLVAPKGYDLAVEACYNLKSTFSNFKWYIIGEGPERKQIESDIQKYGLEENMFLLGTKTNPYPYVANCDIYVQTSKNEGFCLTLAEARMLNKPIVSTNFEVVYNQLVNEVNGLIVEMDSVAISNGINRLIKDEKLRNLLVDNLKKEKKGNVEEIETFYKLINDEK